MKALAKFTLAALVVALCGLSIYFMAQFAQTAYMTWQYNVSKTNCHGQWYEVFRQGYVSFQCYTDQTYRP